WRDWKANTLKKVAKHKIYIMGTGGGSPKDLQLSGTENTLFNFLTPDASGLRDISESGFTNMTPSYDKTSNPFALSNIEEKENEVFSLDVWNDTMMASHETLRWSLRVITLTIYVTISIVGVEFPISLLTF
ncbi:hypothetical protein ALC60_13213, partial [Trachymyrmex zeteki]